ncbi:MAG: TIGR03668 family PPOX class F420-dependent oxidoreductase [Actinomycetota bacterium]|nr:TIGR03668 family PPOX class F420-dependent oxidoreductase [Actinomycetota bacterium]
MRLTDEQCRVRFTGARVARLATVAGDGSPRLVPITFVVAGGLVAGTLTVDDIAVGDIAGAHEAAAGDVVFSAVDHKPKSTTALARLRRIEHEPRVSLLADDYSEDWTRLWWVRADAHAEVLATGPDRECGTALLQEKYEQYRRQPPQHVVIRFVVDRWSGWAAGNSG